MLLDRNAHFAHSEWQNPTRFPHDPRVAVRAGYYPGTCIQVVCVCVCVCVGIPTFSTPSSEVPGDVSLSSPSRPSDANVHHARGRHADPVSDCRTWLCPQPTISSVHIGAIDSTHSGRIVYCGGLRRLIAWPDPGAGKDSAKLSFLH